MRATSSSLLAALLVSLTATGARGDDSPLHLPIELAGYFWTDTGFMRRTNAQAGQYDQDALYLQGRYVLAASYTRRRCDYFATAKLELLGLVNEFAKSQYEPHTLDAYVKAGHVRWWDVQLGRFLAWEVYHRGQGIELYTAEEAGALGGPPLYWLDLTRGHENEAGQLAVHAFPTDFLGLELAAVYGQESNQNHLGVRPVADLHYGRAQLIAGWEYLRQLPQTDADKVEVTSQGLAARLQYTLGPATAGASFARLDVEQIDIQGLVDSDRSLVKWSLGGFFDLELGPSSIGLGYHHTAQENQQDERNRHDQLFASYLFRLPIDGLSVKAVYGFARAHVEDGDTNTAWNNDMHSFRVRVLYELR